MSKLEFHRAKYEQARQKLLDSLEAQLGSVNHATLLRVSALLSPSSTLDSRRPDKESTDSNTKSSTNSKEPNSKLAKALHRVLRDQGPSRPSKLVPKLDPSLFDHINYSHNDYLGSFMRRHPELGFEPVGDGRYDILSEIHSDAPKQKKRRDRGKLLDEVTRHLSSGPPSRGATFHVRDVAKAIGCKPSKLRAIFGILSKRGWIVHQGGRIWAVTSDGLDSMRS